MTRFGHPYRKENFIEKGSEETAVIPSLPFCIDSLHFHCLIFPVFHFQKHQVHFRVPGVVKGHGAGGAFKVLIWARASRTFLESVVVPAFSMAFAASLAET